MYKNLLRTLLVAAIMFSAVATASARNKYLFVYFTGNDPQQEQISYAVSDDGFNYTPLNGGSPLCRPTLLRSLVAFATLTSCAQRAANTSWWLRICARRLVGQAIVA